MSSISIQVISITSLKVDCLVNAANQNLMGGAGVCGAIFREAGWDDLQKACDQIGHCDTGSAVMTEGFGTKARYIIHAVGPVWHGGKAGERKLLASAYRSAMDLARSVASPSIGFPVISAGIYGYPQEEAWEVAIETITAYLAEHPEYTPQIRFAVIDEGMAMLGRDILAEKEGNAVRKLQRNDIIFFWHEYEKNGYLSNWYPAQFTIEGITYATAEQYMMSKKALLAKDYEFYSRIMLEDDPRTDKQYGRRVRGFDEVSFLWHEVREEVVYNANLAKFSQNPELKSKLLATEDRILAEASPIDKTWGIGYEAKDPRARRQEDWRGENRLGEILMRVREELRKK